MPVRLETYTKAELQTKAKQRGKTGFSSLNKKQLIRLLRSGKKSPPKKSRSRRKKSAKHSSKNYGIKGYSPKSSDSNIEKIISENNITIIGKSNCPYCIKAKSELDDRHHKDYKYVEYNKDFKDKLLELNNNYEKVPMIFIDNKFIGGYNEMKEFFEKL
jgi:glutaredoxin